MYVHFLHVSDINRGLGHTKGGYCIVVTDDCIDYKTFEIRSSSFQAYNLDQQAF